MKKLILLLMFSASLQSQELKFDKKPILCENHWVALPVSKDSTHVFGFIYIDEMAGPTFHYEGAFKVKSTGKYEVVSRAEKTAIMKSRLAPNKLLVAQIPESRMNELGVTLKPEWLRFYAGDNNSVERLTKWGNYYNHFGESTTALTFLEKANRINFKHEGLAFELAYAYNALQRFEEAITIINKALIHFPNECQLYKELSYAQINLGKLKNANITYEKAKKFCSDKVVLAEMSLNMAYQYFQKKDLGNFDFWAKEVEVWSNGNDMYSKNLGAMKKALNE